MIVEQKNSLCLSQRYLDTAYTISATALPDFALAIALQTSV